MKKKIILFLAVILLVMPMISTITEAVEAEKPEEIRNQNIYVPTKNGVQRATYEEALKVSELEKEPLINLCESYILGDYKSGKILASYNIDEVRSIASMSKLVSLFVVMDKIKDGTISKDDMVVIDHESASLSGSSYKLKENQQVSVWELVRASLIVSGNDAITALAKHISGSKEAFVDLMNKKCKELGLENAHMVNPTGLTDYSIEDSNKMTTKELFFLSRSLMKEYPELLEITSMAKIEDENRNFLEYNTNPILGIVEGVDGLKTGYTTASGRCVVATGLRKGIEGKTLDTRLIGITTGSKGEWQRYVAIKELMSDGMDTYKYTVIGNLEKPVKTIEVEGASKDEIEVYAKSTGSALWDGDSKITKKVTINSDLKAPIPAGETVGSIVYKMDDEEILKVDAIVKDRVSEKGFLFKIKNLYEDIFSNIKNAA